MLNEEEPCMRDKEGWKQLVAEDVKAAGGTGAGKTNNCNRQAARAVERGSERSRSLALL